MKYVTYKIPQRRILASPNKSAVSFAPNAIYATIPAMGASETPHDAYQAALNDLYQFMRGTNTPRVDRYAANKQDHTRPSRMMAAFGNPHAQYPTIHIAGTKGKGSVAAMCAAALRAAGLRVGLYTSPHTQEFRERIRILTPDDEDGRISEADFVRLMTRFKTELAPDFPESIWFEIVTLIGFTYFAEQQVDVAVIEVGLGGRLDATNVLIPLVSVITTLSLDHTALLGDTIEQIAYEKGGIIKPHVPVVTASQRPAAAAKLKAIAAKRQAPLEAVGEQWQYTAVSDPNSPAQLQVTHSAAPNFLPAGSQFELALAGGHQLENATVALAALCKVRERFPTLTLAAIMEGLATVQWNGRLQTLHQSPDAPTLLLDSAHNPDSANKLATALQDDFTYRQLWLVLGVTIDKNISDIFLALLPLADNHIMLTIADHPRAASPAELAHIATDLGFQVRTAPTIEQAVRTVWQLAQPRDLICVTGSIFVVGDLLNLWPTLKPALLPVQSSRSKIT